MNIKPLDRFVAENGQTEAGRLLGVSAPAISKALAVKRDITVTLNPDGSFTAKESRPFPSRQAEKNLAPTVEQMMPQISTSGQSGKPSGDPYSTEVAR